MAGRQTRGRQRIPMREIEKQDDKYATFSKRRLGLFKKASELTTLCGVDIGIIVSAPSTRSSPYSFFHPNMDSVIRRYENPNQPLNDYARVIDTHTRSKIEELNKELDEILDEKEQLKEYEKHLDETDKTRQKGWWEAPVESLDKEQVKEWMAHFQNFKSQVENRIEELKNGGSTSAAVEQQNPPSFTDVAGPSTGVSNHPPGPSYAPAMGMLDHPFPYVVPPQIQDLSSAGGSSHVLRQYFFPPLPQDPSGSGETGRIPSPFFYPSPRQDPSGSGGSGHVPRQFFYPPRGIPSQFFYPLQTQDPSGSGSGHGPGPLLFPPPPQDPSGSGVPGLFFFPPSSQDPSGGGGSEILSPYFFPPPPVNPSLSGASSDLIVPRQYRYIPRGSEGPSTSAGGSGDEVGTSNQGGN